LSWAFSANFLSIPEKLKFVAIMLLHWAFLQKIFGKNFGEPEAFFDMPENGQSAEAQSLLLWAFSEKRKIGTAYHSELSNAKRRMVCLK